MQRLQSHRLKGTDTVGHSLTGRGLCVVSSVTSVKALWSVSPTQGERLVSTGPQQIDAGRTRHSGHLGGPRRPHLVLNTAATTYNPGPVGGQACQGSNPVPATY